MKPSLSSLKKIWSYAQNVVFDVQKRGPSCPNWGQGGGLGDSGNARKKTFFFIDVFPNKVIGYGDSAKNTQGCYPENITILLTNDIKIVKNLKTV